MLQSDFIKIELNSLRDSFHQPSVFIQILLCLFFQRQDHAEGGAFAGFALDLDAALVGFDDHFALKHADAQAVFLGGLKSAEQLAVHEFVAHAAAVVGYGKDGPAIVLGGGDMDLATGGDGFAGIEDEVDGDLEHLVGIEGEAGQRGKLFFEVDAGDVLPAFKGLGDDGVEVGLGGLDLQFAADGAEPADEVVDAFDGLGDAAQGVGAEFRVVEVHGQILQHQVKCVGGVLHVVDEKRGHGLEGFQLLGLQ